MERSTGGSNTGERKSRCASCRRGVTTGSMIWGEVFLVASGCVEITGIDITDGQQQHWEEYSSSNSNIWYVAAVLGYGVYGAVIKMLSRRIVLPFQEESCT